MQFKALIDTGAQRTMISPNVVSTLKLSAVGKIPIGGVGPTVHFHNACLFHVAFVVPPFGQNLAPGQAVQSVAFILPQSIHGGEIPNTGGRFDVLLGMDVISHGSLKIEGNGQFSFSI
ncbi:MAG: hypothetical protein NTV97_12560 [Alphaproteobacteria bacterium]|nr:hypothetical protein [Alphaproteobacteria bacterium]